MSSSTVLQMIGEFTGAGDVVPVMANVPPRLAMPATRRRQRRRRRPVANENSLIPANAKQISGQVDTDGQDNSDGQDGQDGQNGQDGLGDEASRRPSVDGLLHPALALVAPDCTPDAFKPLDAVQVPKTVVQPPSTGGDATGILKLFTGTDVRKSPVVPKTESVPAMSHQAAPVIPITEEQLRSPMPAPVDSQMAAARSTFKRFSFSD